MKRILLAGLASLSVGVVLPTMSAASPDRAHDHGSGAERHHGRERQRGDRRREHRQRDVQRHEVRHQHFGDTATGSVGTVQSLENGVLTIALADGSTVTGAVTPDTRIACEATGDNDFVSHDRGPRGGDDGNHGDRGDDNSNDNGDRGDDNSPQCAALLQQAGTPVIDAELNIFRGAASWEEVELGS